MKKRHVIAILSGLIVAGSGAGWVISAPSPRFTAADAGSLEAGGDVVRGRRIFLAADCASCHASPGQEDRTRLGGGVALASPFGTFRAPNISPDPKDGIGGWRVIDLANAIMSGVSPDGSHYYPVLPYTTYARMKIEDVRDLMAYLRTLPRVAGRPPQHELTFPLNVRRAVGLWKALFFSPEPLNDEPGHDAEWNRGRYLVEAVTHCAECHSSRNLLGAVKPASRFAGAANPEGIGFAPNITPARLAGWSTHDIVEMLATARTPDHRYVGASMADVVHNTAQLEAEDRQAIATYVKSLPPRATARP